MLYFKFKKKEATLLKLNCDKAISKLNWNAILTFDETIQMTSDWYKYFYEKSHDMSEITVKQIRNYMNLASERDLEWVL